MELKKGREKHEGRRKKENEDRGRYGKN